MSESDFQLKRDNLIRAAFRVVGIKNTTPSHISYGVEALQLVIGELEGEGFPAWVLSQTPYALTTIPGQAEYAAAESDPNKIPLYVREIKRAALFRSNTEEALDLYTENEATNSPLRDESGEPSGVFLEKSARPADQRLVVFPPPNAAYTIRLYYWRMIYEFSDDEAESIEDFPKAWLKALKMKLAEELAPEYGAPNLGDIVGLADKALAKAKKANARKKRPSRPIRMSV